MDGDDLYAALGVAPSATASEVKAAYRSLAKQSHPDAGGTQEAFEAIATAAETLLDVDARRRYDADFLGRDSLALQAVELARELNALDEEVSGSPADIAARARRHAAAEKALQAVEARRQKEKAKDAEEKKARALEQAERKRFKDKSYVAKHGRVGRRAEATLTLTFDEARAGTSTRTVAFERETSCTKCGGWGEKPGHWILAVEKLCPACKGTGRTTRRVEHVVPVAPGSADGDVLTLAGEGHGGFSKQLTVLGQMSEPAAPGDLVVRLVVLREGEAVRA